MALSKEQIRDGIERTLQSAEFEGPLYRTLKPKVRTTCGDEALDALVSLAESDISSAADQS